MARNVACATRDISLPKAAARLPKSLRASSVGTIPACNSVINAWATLSNWNVVCDVNCRITSKESAAVSADPVIAFRVAFRSSNFLVVSTIPFIATPAPILASAVATARIFSLNFLASLLLSPSFDFTCLRSFCS